MAGWVSIIVGCLLIVGGILFFAVVELRLAKRQRQLTEEYEAQHQRELSYQAKRGSTDV